MTPDRPAWRGIDWAFLGTVVVATLAIYLQVRSFPFLPQVDAAVADNRRINHGLTADSVHWAAVTAVDGWRPMTRWAELTISSASGPTPAAFHLTNALLHAINAALLYCLLWYSTGRALPSAFAAAAWAWHPLRSASVAGASALPDPLGAFFVLLALIVYVRHARRPSAVAYGGVVLLTAAAVTSSMAAVIAPLLLLLFDFWPLNRRSAPVRRVLEKLPMFAVAAAAGGYSLYARHGHIFPGRVSVVLTALCLRDAVFPARVAACYPQPTAAWATVAVSALLIVALTGLAWQFRRLRYPVVGWLWFLGSIGVAQLFDATRSDRATYLAGMGLTVAAVWAIADVAVRRGPLKSVAVAVGAVAAAVLAVAAYRTTGGWSDPVALFGRADRAVAGNYRAKQILADTIRGGGDAAGALPIAAEAARIAGDDPDSQASWSAALRETGDVSDAYLVIVAAARAAPASPGVWDESGNVQTAIGNDAMAVAHYGLARNLDPDRLLPAYHAAVATARTGDLPTATTELEAVEADFPKFGRGHGDLGDAYRLARQYDAAVYQYQLAYQLGERHVDWETNLAFLTASIPAYTAADVERVTPAAEDAVRQTGGNDPLALDALGAAYARAGRWATAVAAADAGVSAATAQKRPKLAAELAAHAALYRQEKPYFFGRK